MRQRETEGEKIHQMLKEGGSAKDCNPIPGHVPYSPWNSPGQNTRVGSCSLLQGNLPNSGIEPRSPALQEDSLPAEPQGKPYPVVLGCFSVLPFILVTFWFISHTGDLTGLGGGQQSVPREPGWLPPLTSIPSLGNSAVYTGATLLPISSLFAYTRQLPHINGP